MPASISSGGVPIEMRNSDSGVNPSTSNISEETIESANKFDFLASYDGSAYRRKMLMFAKAFFNGDAKIAKQYLLEPDSTSINFAAKGDRNYENIDFILIKFYDLDQETKTAHSQLEYKWDDSDMYYYLDITMQRIDGDWKILDFFIDA